MTVRTARPERELDDILAIWAGAGPGIQLSPSDKPEEIQKKVQRDPDLFLVYEEDGNIMGVVLGGYDGRRGIVYHLAVPQEFRRKGIGVALMTELEQRLRAKGCYKYYLLVTPDNEGALAFYEELGCERMDLLVLGKVV